MKKEIKEEQDPVITITICASIAWVLWIISAAIAAPESVDKYLAADLVVGLPLLWVSIPFIYNIGKMEEIVALPILMIICCFLSGHGIDIATHFGGLSQETVDYGHACVIITSTFFGFLLGVYLLTEIFAKIDSK